MINDTAFVCFILPYDYAKTVRLHHMLAPTVPDSIASPVLVYRTECASEQCKRRVSKCVISVPSSIYNDDEPIQLNTTEQYQDGCIYNKAVWLFFEHMPLCITYRVFLVARVSS